MSDDTESDLGETAEDRMILELLEELAMEGRQQSAEPALADERRAYLEVIGLLPYGLGEARSTERIKERLMAQVRGELAGGEAAAAAGSVGSREAPAARAPRWLLPLAASLLVVLIGYATWQYRELSVQRATIDSLAAELDGMTRAGASLAAMRSRMQATRSRVVMATSRGAEICMLRPAGEQPLQPSAGGALVIAAERDRWFIRIYGLDPCLDGCSYRVWFVTEDGVVPSVEFDIDPATTDFEYTSTEVPQGLRAVSVTMEAAAGTDEPSGREVLFADQAMQLL